MKLLNHKLQTLQYALDHVAKTIDSNNSPFEMISQAPWFIRLLSRGQYCVYKNTIYVPMFHLELVRSQHEADRTLATSKVLPCIMLLHDNKTVSFVTFMQYLYNINYQLHYFLYEFLFLKATESRFIQTVFMGFLITRRKWFRKASPEMVQQQLCVILENNKTT